MAIEHSHDMPLVARNKERRMDEDGVDIDK